MAPIQLLGRLQHFSGQHEASLRRVRVQGQLQRPRGPVHVRAQRAGAHQVRPDALHQPGELLAECLTSCTLQVRKPRASSIQTLTTGPFNVIPLPPSQHDTVDLKALTGIHTKGLIVMDSCWLHGCSKVYMLSTDPGSSTITASKDQVEQEEGWPKKAKNRNKMC